MFKSDSEIEELLSHSNNKASVKIIGQGQDDRANRKPDTRSERLSIEEKTRIGVLASIIGVKPAAQLVSKTPGSVSRMKNGEDAQGDPLPELAESIAKKKERIQEKALTRAEQFLDMLGVDTTENMKISAATEKVVNVYEKLTPRVQGQVNNTQVIFYAPKILETKDYSIIEVEAQNG